MADMAKADFIDEARISEILAGAGEADGNHVREILARARELKGLEVEDVAVLAGISDPELLGELFAAARYAKDTIYGRRLVLFAPLYVSNLCGNDCTYCAFRARNRAVKRRALTQDEVAREVRILVEQGHKRVLLVAGESYPQQGFKYVLDCVDTIYATRSGPGEIRRVNVNVAPLDTDEFRALKEANIGTYQLFQETYHRETYARVHLGGRKKDYDWRVTVMDRAVEAGLQDVGIGVLFGLWDWRFETLALLQHIRHMEATWGVGPHTVSVPRLEPAIGSEVASHPPKPVGDVDFRKLVAILRLAVPYTGIIMSTRETAHIRDESFALGVSQISAGSRTNPGGYAEDEPEEDFEGAQFSLGDHRPLDEVVRDVASLGYIPSFCTGCYRLGRVGQDFMDLAKPGEIRKHCDPNGLSTFQEYLLDYASPETRAIGDRLIEEVIAGMEGTARTRAEKLVGLVKSGKRDVYV
jgi:2-iminoacetate synthase